MARVRRSKSVWERSDPSFRDEYALEYGPTARKHSQAMNRYYASVNRSIKRALKNKNKDILGTFNRSIAKELRRRRRRARHEGGR